MAEYGVPDYREGVDAARSDVEEFGLAATWANAELLAEKMPDITTRDYGYFIEASMWVFGKIDSSGNHIEHNL